MDTPGKAAYEKWRSAWASEFPCWEERFKNTHVTWEAIAEAAINAHIDACEAPASELGPIVRDMDPAELEQFRAQLPTKIRKGFPSAY